MDRKNKTASLIASGLIAALTAVGVYVMLTYKGESILTAEGANNLQFFTVDSNLLLGLVHLAALILTAAGLTEKNRDLSLWTERLIYIATVAVALTFVVVAGFFGPQVGYPPLFMGANLFFHLINPVLGIAALCILHRNRPIPLWETAAALIPSVLYGLYYTIVLLIYGVHFPETDWYGFAAGGAVGSVVTAFGVFLTTWLLAMLLRVLSGGAKRRAESAPKAR